MAFIDIFLITGLPRILLSLTLGKWVPALRLKRYLRRHRKRQTNEEAVTSYFFNWRWISNIVGTPTCLDPLIAALLVSHSELRLFLFLFDMRIDNLFPFTHIFKGPFPELNDSNAVLPDVSLDHGPILLHGRPPRGHTIFLLSIINFNFPLIQIHDYVIVHTRLQ